ncbi:MAG: methionine adenosyltransferase [Nitrososphaerota archaeon]|nr:methionine adenosyltransferase [Nitrososphaerota archaeon]
MARHHLFTSESVAEGHPDKCSDQISDAILDDVLRQDKKARVDAETLIMQGTVIVTGQITTTAYVNVKQVVRGVLKDIGFNNARDGLDWETCGVLISIEEQSPDIARGVNRPVEEIGSGDQGMTFGYATTETKQLMPLPIMLAHGIVKRLADVRKDGTLPYLRPDGKSQVTVEYDDGKAQRVDAVVVAAQHNESAEESQVKSDVVEKVVRQVIPKDLLDSGTRFIVNGTGRFVIGGTLADSGLTGRKIIVDSYGGVGAHGGGCQSGKDPTKIDRSGAYMARYIAKNIVAAKLAEKCQVQIAYAIGVAKPVSFMVDTYGTGMFSDEKITDAASKTFDMRPGVIIRDLDLLRPIYRKTACYGHFGREDPDFTWEKTDRVAALRAKLS